MRFSRFARVKILAAYFRQAVAERFAAERMKELKKSIKEKVRPVPQTDTTNTQLGEAR